MVLGSKVVQRIALLSKTIRRRTIRMSDVIIPLRPVSRPSPRRIMTNENIRTQFDQIETRPRPSSSPFPQWMRGNGGAAVRSHR